MRYEVVHRGCGPSCDHFHIVRDSIVAVRGVQLRHRLQMMEDVVGQIALAQFVAPLLEWYVDVTNRFAQRAGVFRRDCVHIF